MNGAGEIFPKEPSVEVAQEAAIAEIKKQSARGQDVTAAPYIGDQNVKTSWKQMKDPNGGFLLYRYVAGKREILNKFTPVATLP